MEQRVSPDLDLDDYDLRFYDCQTEYIKPGQDQRIIDDIEIGHYAGYDLVGRTEVDPLPIDPDYRVTGRMWLFALYPILAPEESRGQGLIRWRYADPEKGDDSWDWSPGTRRVRRLNEAMMSRRPARRPMTRIIIPGSTRRPSSTITASSGNARCWPALTPRTRPR